MLNVVGEKEKNKANLFFLFFFQISAFKFKFCHRSHSFCVLMSPYDGLFRVDAMSSSSERVVERVIATASAKDRSPAPFW
jgi:hypothetical protein